VGAKARVATCSTGFSGFRKSDHVPVVPDQDACPGVTTGIGACWRWPCCLLARFTLGLALDLVACAQAPGTPTSGLCQDPEQSPSAACQCAPAHAPSARERTVPATVLARRLRPGDADGPRATAGSHFAMPAGTASVSRDLGWRVSNGMPPSTTRAMLRRDKSPSILNRHLVAPSGKTS
jgi:hypothetical protein